MQKPGSSWADDWIIVQYLVQNKERVTAIRFSEIERIEFDSKLAGGKLKRTEVWTLRDGSTYSLPDDAILVQRPDAYAQLVGAAAQNVPI